MAYKLAVFDMDGTILNTLEDLTDALNFTLKKQGFPTRSVPEVRSFIGNGVGKLIKRGAPTNTDDETLFAMYLDFKDYYKAHKADKTAPYDGVEELLIALRSDLRNAKIKTAVLSNKADFAVKELCDTYFKGLFDLSLGERDGVPRKPDPAAVFEIMDFLGVKGSETVYIGDSEVDLETARRAGIDCIIVDWGYKRGEIASDGKSVRQVRVVREAGEIYDILTR